jgi:uncharacterized DUF497 family protein
MRIDYQLHGIRFEWESEKAATNLRKHGISFETACEVFFDPFLRMLDPENLDGQIREAIIGLTMNWKLIYVIYTMRKGDIFRIISARSVTKYERRLYEEQ